MLLDFPDNEAMRACHETIYQAIYVQGTGELRKDFAKALRRGRAVRRPRGEGRSRRPRFREPMVMINERPAEIADRAVPGHWKGDLICGSANKSAIGTLVERATRYTILLALPDGHDAEHGDVVGGDGIGEAMRDEQHRLMLGEPVHRLHDEPFAIRVHRTRRLVEDHDRRVAQQCTRYGNALALAAGEVRVHRTRRLVEDHDRRVAQQCTRYGNALALAAGEVRRVLFDPHVQSVGLRVDEVKDVGVGERTPQFPVGRVRLRHQQVVAQRPGEQMAAGADDRHRMHSPRPVRSACPIRRAARR